jgi:hypothetical protein
MWLSLVEVLGGPLEEFRVASRGYHRAQGLKRGEAATWSRRWWGLVYRLNVLLRGGRGVIVFVIVVEDGHFGADVGIEVDD